MAGCLGAASDPGTEWLASSRRVAGPVAGPAALRCPQR